MSLQQSAVDAGNSVASVSINSGFTIAFWLYLAQPLSDAATGATTFILQIGDNDNENTAMHLYCSQNNVLMVMSTETD